MQRERDSPAYRWLVYTSPASGDLYPVVPTLLELRARGHTVVVRTLAAEVEPLRAIGLDAGPVDERVAAIELGDWRCRSSAAAIRTAMTAFARRAPFELAELRRAVSQERPDALLVDINAKGAALAAECSGLPWAMYASFPLYLRSRDTPPFGPGLKPRGGSLGRLRDTLVRKLLERPFIDSQRLLNDLRAREGVAPLPTPEAFLRIPSLLLSYTAEPFEYEQSDRPASVRLVGPGLWEPPLPEPPPAALDPSRPLILVTASTDFQDDRRLIETTLEAFRDRPVRVLASTGAHDPTTFAGHSNAVIVRSVSHRRVLTGAACVVCHGGMGITQKALAAAVPVCAVPFGRDQHEVARRLELCGGGVRLPARRLDPSRLRAGVDRAIAQRDGAARIASAFAAIDGANLAADALDRVIRA